MKQEKITIGWLIKEIIYSTIRYVVPIILLISPIFITLYTLYTTSLCYEITSDSWNKKPCIVYGILVYIITTIISFLLSFIIVMLTNRDDDESEKDSE